jgi:hypothetical protein
MSERQENFITWLYQIGAFYLMIPLGTNILKWMTGDKLIDITRLTLSVIVGLYGIWCLLVTTQV